MRVVRPRVYSCFRCGHEWLSRLPERPRRCARCKSPYWDRPRTGSRDTKRRGPSWDAGQVRSLRQHLGLSQRELADELGTRQQTISEWETAQYRPRGASARLLTLVAERAGFRYEAGRRSEGGE